MTVIERVKWDSTPNLLAWKFPSEELATWTQLIVNESQEAFVVKNGVYDGPFGAGKHTLSTENIPFLRKLMGLPFGGKSPFSAEVWFVNKVVNLDIRWGTTDPIQLQDPKFGIMVPIRAFGQYGIRIEDSKAFLLKLVGALPGFDTNTLSEYFRGVFTTKIKTSIADAIVNSGYSILEISTKLDELSGLLKANLASEIAEYGVTLTQFNIHSINFPEAEPGVQKLKAALARRAEMGIVGYSYQQERSFDILQTAARNEGNVGSLIGTGMGTGIGVAIGVPVGQAYSQMAARIQTGENIQVQATAVANTSTPQETNSNATSGHAERIELLSKLGELRNQGILTDAEFDTEKKRILGQ